MPRKRKIPTERENAAAENLVVTAAAPEKTRRAATKPASDTVRSTREKTPRKRATQVDQSQPVEVLSAEQILDSAVSERERIALLAHSYWETRGCQGGSPEEDWFRAEREIRSQREQVAKSQ